MAIAVSSASRTGMWVVLAAMTMSFAAFTSALLVRQGASLDWQHLAMPRILYFNAIVLVASTATLEVARRRVASFMAGDKSDVVPMGWLYATLVLGLIFVAGQYAAWRQLRSQGIFLPTNPSSSFFYVFTAMHGLHVLFGLGGLTLVIWKLKRRILRRSTLDAASRYWHFMDILWLYLLLLFWMRF